jgi:hypothetical protein
VDCSDPGSRFWGVATTDWALEVEPVPITQRRRFCGFVQLSPGRRFLNRNQLSSMMVSIAAANHPRYPTYDYRASRPSLLDWGVCSTTKVPSSQQKIQLLHFKSPDLPPLAFFSSHFSPSLFTALFLEHLVPALRAVLAVQHKIRH